MPDVHRKPLRAGDKVAYGSTTKGLVIGTLRYDEEEKHSYHLETQHGMYYPQKWGRNGIDKNILNLTLYMEEQDARL